MEEFVKGDFVVGGKIIDIWNGSMLLKGTDMQSRKGGQYYA
jgi:hypothetical protein